MRVAGLGFRQSATLADLREALNLAEAGGGPVQALAVPSAKADAPALLALAAERGLPVLAVRVAGVATPTRSTASLRTHGTGSVAEAAALSANETARLVARRIVGPSRRATCAIAACGPQVAPDQTEAVP